MKKFTYTLLLITAGFHALNAQTGFKVTMKNVGSFVTVYIRPEATITTDIAVMDFYIRYPNTQTVTFTDPVENVAAFPGMRTGSGAQVGFEVLQGSYGAYRFVEIFYAGPNPSIPSQTYNAFQEYPVFTTYVGGPVPANTIANLELVHSVSETDVYLGLTSGGGGPGELRFNIGGTLDPDHFFYPSTTIIPAAGDMFYSYGPSAGVALTASLVNFTAKVENTGALLSWKTESEVNVSHFDVEKSLDGKAFIKIGEKKANNLPSDYSTFDENFNESSYYRLKINELDGRYNLSKVVYLEKKDGKNIKIARYTERSLSVETDDKIEAIIISNTVGQVLKSSKDKQISVSDLGAGMYLISVKTDKGFVSQKFFKN
jgi:hypothetical protein